MICQYLVFTNEIIIIFALAAKRSQGLKTATSSKTCDVQEDVEMVSSRTSERLTADTMKPAASVTSGFIAGESEN